MKPNVNDQSFQRSYSEVRTESLVLCSGFNGLHQHKLNQHQSYNPGQPKAFHSLPQDKLGVLLSCDNLLPGTRRNGSFQKPYSNSRLLPAKLKTNRANEPHLVKVSVYTKSVNPYIVVYDSNKKYATPIAYLKLVNYTVAAGSASRKDDVNGDDESDCTFRFIPNRHEDLDNASVITFRALTSEKRNEWVRYLNALCLGTNSYPEYKTGYASGSSVLPTLVEEENTEGTLTLSSDTYKLSSPRKKREGRRNSLNSVGSRLRCRNKFV